MLTERIACEIIGHLRQGRLVVLTADYGTVFHIRLYHPTNEAIKGVFKLADNFIQVDVAKGYGTRTIYPVAEKEEI